MMMWHHHNSQEIGKENGSHLTFVSVLAVIGKILAKTKTLQSSQPMRWTNEHAPYPFFHWKEW